VVEGRQDANMPSRCCYITDLSDRDPIRCRNSPLISDLIENCPRTFMLPFTCTPVLKAMERGSWNSFPVLCAFLGVNCVSLTIVPPRPFGVVNCYDSWRAVVYDSPKGGCK